MQSMQEGMNMMRGMGGPMMMGGPGGMGPGAMVGGPMMGVAQSNLDAPIVKGTTGVVVLTKAEVRDARVEPCIHCGRCLDACPMFLNPSTLGDLARVGRYDEMEALHLMDCMLCGSCSYVCPSNIPLAQYFALSKAAIRRKPAAPVAA